MGVVFQAPALDARLTVQENLTTHGHLYGLSGTRLRSRLSAVLAMVALEDRSSDMVGTLSGGLQRRVEIAKALLPEPRLLVLDEPGTGLDPGARRELWDHLAGLRDTLGTTVVLTTHLMDEAARSDNVALLHEGRLVALGAPRVLVSEIGGDVIIVASAEVESLARDIRDRFDQPVDVVDGHVRIERTNGHQLITELIDAFPGRIDGVTYGKPTLEDVFLHHTGQRWGS
jgi:ABC-2 type transport system ATP-binding protein